VTLETDDLSTPLRGRPRRPERRPLPWTAILAGLAGVLTVGTMLQAALLRREGGAREVVALIQRAAPDVQPEAARPGALVQAVPAVADKPVLAAGEMEDASGVKVVRGGGGGDAPSSIIIQVPQAPVKLTPAPDKRLAERSRHGMLPRVGADGAKASQVYARPPESTPALAGKPRVALMVGGLGISQATTAEAIAKLPPQISLAFAPYASDAERQVGKARADGHEVLVQVPMEPFDYPENDPGPHTLRTAEGEADNIDRLHWVLSRFPGYVGVTNVMGAKFSANAGALRPVLKEVADRGLLFLDDGSSNRSLVGELAAPARLDAARADVAIDASLRGEAIEAALARLEALARERGVAIGTASALPLSVERVARWAKGLEAKGILLVPVSAAVASARKS